MSHSDYDKVSRLFRAARKLRGKTQVEVAKNLGVSQSCISKIESGKLLPSVTEWFSFAQFVNIRPDEAYHYGVLDQALPVGPDGAQPAHGFKIPERYRRHAQSKIRTTVPFAKFFQQTFGALKWSQYIKKAGLDSDFFSVLDAEISPQFSLDIVTQLIESGHLKPEQIPALAESARSREYHGAIASQYSTSRDSLELISLLLKSARQYEANFNYVIEDFRSDRLEVSISPNPHMSEVDYRTETLGTFVCDYKKQFFSQFGRYHDGSAVRLVEKECHYRGADKCTYQIFHS